MLCYFFTFHIAGQVQNYAYHQVSESIQEHFVWSIFGHFPLQGCLEFFYDYIEQVLVLNEVRHLFYAVLISCEVQEDCGSWVFNLN